MTSNTAQVFVLQKGSEVRAGNLVVLMVLAVYSTALASSFCRSYSGFKHHQVESFSGPAESCRRHTTRIKPIYISALKTIRMLQDAC